jgi:hypothetical protein
MNGREGEGIHAADEQTMPSKRRQREELALSACA